MQVPFSQSAKKAYGLHGRRIRVKNADQWPESEPEFVRDPRGNSNSFKNKQGYSASNLFHPQPPPLAYLAEVKKEKRDLRVMNGQISNLKKMVG